MSSQAITWSGHSMDYDPARGNENDYRNEDKRIVYQQEQVIETTIDLERLIKFQDRKENLISSSKYYYPVSYVLSRLMLIAGLLGIAGFLFGFYDLLIVPILLTIGGAGMMRTISMAAFERVKGDEERD